MERNAGVVFPPRRSAKARVGSRAAQHVCSVGHVQVRKRRAQRPSCEPCFARVRLVTPCFGVEAVGFRPKPSVCGHGSTLREWHWHDRGVAAKTTPTVTAVCQLTHHLPERHGFSQYTVMNTQKRGVAAVSGDLRPTFDDVGAPKPWTMAAADWHRALLHPVFPIVGHQTSRDPSADLVFNWCLAAFMSHYTQSLDAEVFFLPICGPDDRSEGFPRTRLTKRSCACDCEREPASVGAFFFLSSFFLSFFLLSFFFSHPESSLKIKIFAGKNDVLGSARGGRRGQRKKKKKTKNKRTKKT